MRFFATLTSRLVVTAVALVAVVCVLMGAVTTLAMRSQLMDRLDADVRSLGRPGPPSSRNVAPGTLQVILPGEGSSVRAQGQIYSRDVNDEDTITDLDNFDGVPVDGNVHTVEVPGHGSYRVTARDLPLQVGQTQEVVTLVTGLPTKTVDDTIAGLLRWEALLTLLGIVAAAGAGTFVVRRQLRPLRDVAATAHTVAGLPLDTGDIGVTERVPERLTDARSEVGQVGNALNTLLEHVESSLAARHRSEQQVRQFVADASHELRTPLTTIRGYTELARQHPEDAEAAKVAFAKVEEESGRMTSLVEDLLLLARLDAGRPLEHHPVDLTRLLIEAASDARVVDPERRWQLVLPASADPESDAGVLVPGDEQRLHQVVTNLLGNATRYTPPGTTVTVRVLADGFDVHDDGPGFPPSIAARAFERFVRGDESRHRGGESGAGLGLALVQAIVQSHGGTVALQSRPGDTTIRVRLPR
ncbi:HAMP domain-containing sensor histidine kinase [Nocardioides sp. CER19]|uniref:sensor histidine kinase n=1 Tax=Nocardioides sp. CER19 TaxID=3038538 RepID=UPI00244C837F|nr:HAMP domain-containing sensor histidine kinase [Nocardioides sp. CER19]MDH2416792.1 HAMP domain-containing sensor histidine kinase [Nocardioides sp. CER19]